MTVANLGLAVDSRQAASAVVDLDALAASAGRAEKSADSMASGAKRAETATAAMARTIRETVGANDNATSAINRHVQAIQALTAAESRGGSNSYAQRAADIEAYGRSLDDMRAKINPAYAAIRQYREQVESIRSAHRLGAVSADEMTAAINRERSATLASLAALRERDQAIASSRSPGAGYSSNIGAQIQDTVVSAVGGMSASQIALQQGTQLASVLTDLRAQGLSTGAALASAFAGVLSPISLLTIGVVGASAALIQYLASGSEVSKLDDRLKTHAANVSALREAYGDALEGATTYAKESTDVLILAARTSAEAVRTSLKAMTTDIASSLEASLAAAPFEAAFAGYEEFEGAIKALSEAAKAGRPGIQAFRQSVADIAAARPSDKFLQELAGRFLELTNRAGEVERAVDGSNRAIAETGRIASGQTDAINSYGEALLALSKIAVPQMSVMDQIDAQLQRGLANAGGEKWREDLLYQQAEDAKTRYLAEEEKKRAEIAGRQAEQNAERIAREAQQQSDMLARRVEMHQWALMTEQEQERARFETQMEELDQFYQGKAELEAEYRDLRERAEEDHAARVTDIIDRQAQRELAVKQQEFRVMGDMFGNLATVANAFGEKGFLAAKAFSIGQAVMNTSEAITAALASAPPPLNFAAAAAVAAAGAVQIAAIASAKPGNARTPTVSGGGGYAAGGSAAGGGPAVQKPSETATPTPIYLNVTGDLKQPMEELFRTINDGLKDGYRIILPS